MVLNPSSVAPDIVGVATPTTPGDNIVAIATSNSNVTGGNRSIRSSAKLSQKSNRSGKDVSSGMFSSSRNSKGVLKPQTSFSGNKIGTETVEGPKRLTFADEHGEMLVLNVFVDQLHYGESQISLSNKGPEPTQKCCIIS